MSNDTKIKNRQRIDEGEWRKRTPGANDERRETEERLEDAVQERIEHVIDEVTLVASVRSTTTK